MLQRLLCLLASYLVAIFGPATKALGNLPDAAPVKAHSETGCAVYAAFEARLQPSLSMKTLNSVQVLDDSGTGTRRTLLLLLLLLLPRLEALCCALELLAVRTST